MEAFKLDFYIYLSISYVITKFLHSQGSARRMGTLVKQLKKSVSTKTIFIMVDEISERIRAYKSKKPIF